MTTNEEKSMFERLQEMTSFKVSRVENLDFPRDGDEFILRTHGDLRRLEVELDFKDRSLRGKRDRRSRQIEGDYLDTGTFKLSLQKGDPPVLLCQVYARSPLGDIPQGSWTADEDGGGRDPDA